MKFNILFPSILISFLFTISIVSAALTVSVSLPTKSLTENEQVTVTVTVTNTAGSSTESNIVTTLSSSTSWFSVVTDCSSISSLLGGASQTTTCIIKPTSTGSDLSLTSSATSQGGTTGSGTTSGINVASQSSSLTASISADSSVGTNTNLFAGVTVTAPAANDVVNTRATMSTSGQCSVDTAYVPAQQNLGNITKGTSKSPANWRISSTTDGTCTLTVNVVSDVGGTASPTKSITVGAGSGGESGGGAGGGGGGFAITGQSVLLTVTSLPKVSLQIGKVTITGLIIAAGKQTTVDIDKTEDVAFRKITIHSTNPIKNVQISITKLADKPTSITQELTGKVYHYIQVNKTNATDADISQTTIRFELEKSWISANSIDKSTIALYRYSDNAWNKLQTTEISEDANAVLYDAESPGLSVFAISGEAVSEAPTTVAPTPSPTEQPPAQPTPLPISQTAMLWTIMSAIVIIGIIVFVLIRKGS